MLQDETPQLRGVMSIPKGMSFPVGEKGEREKRGKGEKGETASSQKGSVLSISNDGQLIAEPPSADSRISLPKSS